jgi:hypothetical protein
MVKRLTTTILVGLLLGVGLSAQPLSNQVLALLSRVNTWTAKQTFLDLRLTTGVPSDTTLRFYVDTSNNLYFNGGLVAGAGGGVTPHTLLSTTHSDTLLSTPVRGSVIVANVTPAWARLALCANGQYLGSNGTDTLCLNTAASFTNIPAAQLTGTIAAISGVNLTALNATQLTSGTVPLARLSGITTTEIAAGAAIPYSKLSLTGGIVNADVSGSAAIVYSKLSLANSILTGDIAAGTLLFSDWASNGCTAGQFSYYDGAAWACRTIVPGDISGGSGSVSSVALAAPAIYTVTGSPITTTGTLTLTLATQTANFVWAGPASAGPTAPTFRALVNADLPLTGVAAATYPKVTVNTRGVVTAASSQITLTTDVTGTLPMANGGTGVAASADDTLLIGSGAAWVAQTLPNCPTGALAYTTATNLFNCTSTGGPTHAMLSVTHSDSLAAAVTRGAVIVGNSTPAWSRLTIGAAGTFLRSDGTDAAWGTLVSGLTSTTAGAGTLGSVALPFASVILGTAATNVLTVSPAAFTNGLVATVDNPGTFTTAKLPLVRRGTIAYTSGAITNGTCATAVTATETGLATTSVVYANLDGALQTNWKTGVHYFVYPTANTVNITVCNGTAGSITPESDTFNYVAFVP